MAIGGVGVSSETPPPSDLDTIYLGGEYFLDRMKAMGQATADSKKALADLNLGRDAVGAHADAKKALADAQKKLADATSALADANEKAAKTISDAKTQSEKIISDAKASAASIVAQANDSKAAADAYVGKVTKQVNDLLADTKLKNDDMSSLTALAKKSKTDADAAKAASDAATKAAQATQKSFQDKIAKLQSVIAG
jgi:hypothetical protein